MKIKIYSIALGLALGLSGPAFGAVSYTGTPLLENFDSLQPSNQTGAFPNDGTPTLVPGGTGWLGARLSGNSTSNGNYVSWHSAVTSSTGAVVGATTLSGETERALGTLTSAAHQNAIGVEIVNNSSAVLTFAKVSFTQEHWRRPGSGAGLTVGEVNVTLAEYGTTASGINSSNIFSATTGYTNVASLNLVSAPPADDPENPGNHLGAAFLDGNLPENQAMTSAIIDLSATPVGIGESFFLRFNDLDSMGADGITAIDNFSFSGSLPGDFNSDGNVDGQDFVAWQMNFPKASDASLSQGDADGDGDVDGADFVVWQTNFSPSSELGVSPVPEPAAWMLAMLGALLSTSQLRRFVAASVSGNNQ